jgi:hypothetical protein
MRSPTLLLLCSLVLFAALFLVSTSRAAEVRFPYASADGPARYAGWVPTYAAAAAAVAGRHAPLHRVTLYLAPRNLDRLDVRPPPKKQKSFFECELKFLFLFFFSLK